MPQSVITAPAGVEISLDQTTWETELVIQLDLDTPVDIYARVNSPTPVTIDDDIEFVTQGAENEFLGVTAEVREKEIVFTPESLSFGNIKSGTPSNRKSLSIEFIGDFTLAKITAPEHFEISEDDIFWKKEIEIGSIENDVFSIFCRFNTSEEGTLSVDIEVETAELTDEISASCFLYLEKIKKKNDEIDVLLLSDGFDFDLQVNEDIEATDGFDTLIYTLLFTDGRATEINNWDKRGWPGDSEKIFKSKLWTKDMSKMTSKKMREIEVFAEKALEYVVKKKIAKSVTAECTQTEKKDIILKIDLLIGNDIIKKYVPIWRNT